ncbi:MAG: prepilin-type N-terminal cleavage/methylation domain-containing protein [Nitrospirae bacterium]|nr:prepilin-type N-terminal cleavage/methylation domain-containing protein [Nitrospirota bacterium]
MNLNNNKGLTLLEIVIALALSLVIIVILLAALRLGYKSQEKGTERAEITQKMRIIGDRITWLIRGVYPYYLKRSDIQRIYFDGRGDRLGFVTTSVDSFGKGPEDSAGLKWVSLYTDNNGLTIREKVFFLEDVFDDSGGKVYLLDPEVRKLEIEYFDVPEDEKEGTWVTQWDPDDKKYFPSAVKVKISFEHNGRTTVMPELIVSINIRKKLNL